MAKTYYEKLRDPRWQRKRLEIMERDEFACCHCGDFESTLNVHHAYYAAKTDPWDYEEGSLVTLCEDCHKRAEAARVALLRGIVSFPAWLVDVVAMVVGTIGETPHCRAMDFGSCLLDEIQRRIASGATWEAADVLEGASRAAIERYESFGMKWSERRG
jgi:hypothetical protein